MLLTDYSCNLVYIYMVIFISNYGHSMGKYTTTVRIFELDHLLTYDSNIFILCLPVITTQIGNVVSTTKSIRSMKWNLFHA